MPSKQTPCYAIVTAIIKVDSIISVFMGFCGMFFRIHPSIRFEYFIAFLKGAKFLIGNSSCLLKESPYLGIPSINIGSRQNGRMGSTYSSVFHANALKDEILLAIQKAKDFKHQYKHHKVRTKSNELFFDLLQKGLFFDIPKQKKFLDI